MVDEELHVRALKIADESQRMLIECNCRKIDEIGMLYAPVDDDGEDVVGLEDAVDGVADACAWLIVRGLGDVVDLPDGPVIVLYGEV